MLWKHGESKKQELLMIKEDDETSLNGLIGIRYRRVGSTTGEKKWVLFSSLEHQRTERTILAGAEWGHEFHEM